MADSALIAVGGFIATAMTGIAGIYFSYRAQRTPLRQALYERQLDVLLEFVPVATRQCKLAGVLAEMQKLSDEEQKSLDEAWDEVNGTLLYVVQRAGVLLPSEMYSAMTSCCVAAEDFETAIVKGARVGQRYNELSRAVSHAGMMAREFVGADTLSSESLRLHNRKGVKNIKAMGAQGASRVFRYFWQPRRRMDAARWEEPESSQAQKDDPAGARVHRD
jgi:hypothetical protein